MSEWGVSECERAALLTAGLINPAISETTVVRYALELGRIIQDGMQAALGPAYTPPFGLNFERVQTPVGYTFVFRLSSTHPALLQAFRDVTTLIDMEIKATSLFDAQGVMQLPRCALN